MSEKIIQGCWLLDEIGVTGFQKEEQSSFIGGKPSLPQETDIPLCKLCGAEQTFYLQIAFPDKHVWTGLTLAVFSCTTCVDENHLIPEMLNSSLNGADIPLHFLNEYQKNFRLLVFETSRGKLRRDYSEKILYKPLYLRPLGNPSVVGNKVGGIPNWLLDDEAPRTYAIEHEMFFLLQLSSDTKFDILDSAPSQVELGLRGYPESSPNRYYQLFNGNEIYMFGVLGTEKPLVYVLTQI
ncbi:MAG: hypothetical protein HY080_02245 [Gammaproteobacteria bacterium]|nr:hypothetical protein [Gammaproteobacteria bacterium]